MVTDEHHIATCTSSPHGNLLIRVFSIDALKKISGVCSQMNFHNEITSIAAVQMLTEHSQGNLNSCLT